MSMTKKDYEIVAGAMRKALRTWTPDTKERQTAIYAIKDVMMTVADDLKLENSKFDRDKFLKACGVTE